MKPITEKTAVMTARFTIDFLNKTITGTKASFDKASKGSGPIYEELTAKVAAHPTFTFQVKEQKHRSNKPKRTYDGMTLDFMKEYISIQGEEAQRLLAEYEGVKDFVKHNQYSLYPFMKKWFLGKFTTKAKPFDMEKAWKEIQEARMERARRSAVEPTHNDANAA